MDRYIGLDVHMQSCTMAVMGASGRQVREEVVATNGRDLVEAIRKVEGHRHLCVEEGTQSEWLYELLEPHVRFWGRSVLSGHFAGSGIGFA